MRICHRRTIRVEWWWYGMVEEEEEEEEDLIVFNDTIEGPSGGGTVW